MNELSFDNVSLVYKKDGREVQALDGLSFSVASGASVAIIGPSGCGKSSLLKMACGLLAPSSGQVSIDGAPIDRPRSETAFIPQDFGILPWKNVQANAELGLKIRHVPRRERKQRAACVLGSLGLGEFARSYPSELSGGMKQRLALARALTLDIDLLLMDEPLSALDSLMREQIQDMLLDLWCERRYAQVMVTHSIEEAVFLGERIVIMDSRPGKVVAQIDNPDMGSVSYRQSAIFHDRCDEIRSLLMGRYASESSLEASSRSGMAVM